MLLLHYWFQMFLVVANPNAFGEVDRDVEGNAETKKFYAASVSMLSLSIISRTAL